MKTETPSPTVLRALGLAAAASLIISALALAVRKPLYESLSGAAFDTPSVHGLVDLVASSGLLVLIAITAVVAIAAWRRGLDSFVLLVSAGVGTITAYTMSEVIKLLVTEQRPCREMSVDTIMACPATGDWSWPSNHATIAAALATSCILVAPHLWRLVAPIAGLIALSRVLAGVHYTHDVTAGITLGIIATLVVAVLVNRLLSRALAATSRPTTRDQRRPHR